MKKGSSDLKMAKNKEKKRARGSNSTAEEDVSIRRNDPGKAAQDSRGH